MMKTLLLSSLAVLSVTVNALELPAKSKADGRIQYVDYMENNVVRVNATNGFITTVVFDENEVVENYGSGYSTAWEFAASKNNFFLKPKAKDGTTNLVVVTNRHIYSLDVHLMENPSDATYRLTYTYNTEKQKLKKLKAENEAIRKVLSKTDPNVSESHPEGNYNYTENFGNSENSKLIAPVMVHDNGRFTYFKFRNNQDFPAVYRVSSDGESLVNYHVENGVLVVHGVYKEYRLRAGSDVVGVYNESYEEKYNTQFDVTPVEPVTVDGIIREFR